jgi:hypothetical protein
MQMKAKIVWCAILGLAFFLTIPLNAQDSAKTEAPATQQPIATYRLNFTMNELEDGKTIDVRSYTMNLNAGDGNEVKIGTRVPVEAKQGEFQYIDVGTTIWCKLKESGNGISLDVRAEFSNFAVRDQENRTTMPLLRQFSIRGSTITSSGKPVTIGSVDDPNSKRRFQLEVTATKVK